MSNDPYVAPSADLQADAATIKTSIWSANGRLGVLSYLAQSLVMMLVLTVVMGAVVAIIGAVFGGMENIIASAESMDFSNPAILIPALILIPLFLLGMYVGICLLIKRLHDRGHSGWWALPLTVLSLIPVVGLISLIGFIYVMFFPGHKHANRFGGQRTTKGWEKILGILYILLIVGSIVAGIGGAVFMGAGAI